MLSFSRFIGASIINKMLSLQKYAVLSKETNVNVVSVVLVYLLFLLTK